MDRSAWLGLAGVLGLVVLHGVAAAARAAFSSVRRGRLRQLAEAGSAPACRAARVAEDASRMLGTLYLAKALLAILAAVVATLTLSAPLTHALNRILIPSPWADVLSLLVITGGLATVILVVGRLVPEAVAAANPERWALRLVDLVVVLEILLQPLVRFAVWVSNRLARLMGGVPFTGISLITEEEIRTIVDAGEEEGVIEEDEKEMIYSIFELGETLAREVMVPRIDIVAIDVNTPLEEAVEVVVQAGHSRIPVYERTIDSIVGVLYAKDLLIDLRGCGARPSLREILRPAYFVPETKKVDDLLREMQRNRIHIAIVVDEYGGTAGLVTVEDILEEIVGEIQDEYDREEATLEAVGEGEYLVDARMNLYDLNEQLGADLPTEPADTLGGLIYGLLGRVPVPGDVVEIGDWRVEVLTVVGRRIGRVRMTRTDAGAGHGGSRTQMNAD